MTGDLRTALAKWGPFVGGIVVALLLLAAVLLMDAPQPEGLVPFYQDAYHDDSDHERR